MLIINVLQKLSYPLDRYSKRSKGGFKLMIPGYMILRRNTKMSDYLLYIHLCAINESEVSNHLDTGTVMRTWTRGEGVKSTKKGLYAPFAP